MQILVEGVVGVSIAHGLRRLLKVLLVGTIDEHGKVFGETTS